VGTGERAIRAPQGLVRGAWGRGFYGHPVSLAFSRFIVLGKLGSLPSHLGCVAQWATPLSSPLFSTSRGTKPVVVDVQLIRTDPPTSTWDGSNATPAGAKNGRWASAEAGTLPALAPRTWVAVLPAIGVHGSHHGVGANAEIDGDSAWLVTLNLLEKQRQALPSTPHLTGRAGSPRRAGAPFRFPAVTPLCRVTTLAFACELTIADSLSFRYRWRLTTFKRVSFGIWTYAMDAGETGLHFEQAWSFLYPDAAHLHLEVEGGKAGPVEVRPLVTCQKPLGHTLAIDAV
jgi:hypothetical protein